MKGKRGFAIVELIVVAYLLVILASIALVSYGKYRKYAVRSALISDLRNCLTHINASRQSPEDGNVSNILANCAKSPTTQSIELVSESPDIVLKASSVDEELSCTYTATGGVVCESPF